MIITKKQGFAALSRERNRELAIQGGKASWAKGAAHKWTREEARIAGRKGGLAAKSPRRRKTAPARRGKKRQVAATE